jgi:glycosyltransferase involved in cell wall biosynthesis
VVTFAGNLGRAQSLDTLLAAARLLLKTSPAETPVKFLLIGDGTEKAKIARQIIDEELHNVQLIGWVNKDDLTRFFSLTSAFVVLLEDNEVLNLTLPAKVQTYMAAGKPILAAASPGGNSELARVIKAADCGLVSPSGDSKTLAANIQRMSQYSKAELRKLGANARTYSRGNFDQNKLYRQLEQRLERISQGRIEK